MGSKMSHIRLARRSQRQIKTAKARKKTFSGRVRLDKADRLMYGQGRSSCTPLVCGRKFLFHNLADGTLPGIWRISSPATEP
jgi:hypothetical protein